MFQNSAVLLQSFIWTCFAYVRECKRYVNYIRERSFKTIGNFDGSYFAPINFKTDIMSKQISQKYLNRELAGFENIFRKQKSMFYKILKCPRLRDRGSG